MGTKRREMAFLNSTTFPSVVGLGFQDLLNDPTTRSIWYTLAIVHDYENHDMMTLHSLGSNIFISHFGQLAVICLWLSGNIFHIASEGNYDMWTLNPIRIRPIAHIQVDPHFGQNATLAYTRGGTMSTVNNETSGLFQILFTIGIRNSASLYWSDLLILLTLFIGFISAWLHSQYKYLPIYVFNLSIQCQHNLAGLISIGSMFWSAHLFHVYY